MPKTTPKNRAAYLRAYRARKAGRGLCGPPYICRQCHQEFVVERNDARYCTDACRAAAWRAIRHRGIQHEPDGWIIPANEYGAGQRRSCAHMFENHEFCRRPATWLGTSCRNGSHSLIALAYRCDEHCSVEMRAAGCDPEAACHRGARCPAKLSRAPLLR